MHNPNNIFELFHQYATDYTSPEDKVLYDLNRKTHLEIDIPQMLSGHLQGRFLEMLSRMIQPEYILEIGTYTGYSAICLAKGLRENGKLISLDNNKYLREIQQEYIFLSGLQDKIECITGDAKEIIPELDQSFDLVFIDADKQGYATYLDLIMPKVKPGGFIIADNCFYDGEVLDPEKAGKNGKAIHDFNQKVKNHPGLENILVPLRDGLMLMRKID